MTGILRTQGSRLVDEGGAVVRLQGIGLGGWMNMENFITGYPAQRGDDARRGHAQCSVTEAAVFFDRLLDVFFDRCGRRPARPQRPQLRSSSGELPPFRE